MKKVHEYIDLIAQISDTGLGLFVPLLLIGFLGFLLAFTCKGIELPKFKSLYDLIMGDYHEV